MHSGQAQGRWPNVQGAVGLGYCWQITLESGIAWSGKMAAGDFSHSFFSAMTGSELPIEIRK